MAIDSIQSGYNLINQSSQMATKVADDINSIQKQETNTRSDQKESYLNPVEQQKTLESNQKTSSDYLEPLIQLNQAVQYSKVGTNIVQKNQEMIGSLLDVRV